MHPYYDMLREKLGYVRVAFGLLLKMKFLVMMYTHISQSQRVFTSLKAAICVNNLRRNRLQRVGSILYNFVKFQSLAVGILASS